MKKGHKRDLDFEYISIRENLKTKTKTSREKKKKTFNEQGPAFQFFLWSDEEVLQVMPGLHKLICAIHE